MPDVTDFRVLIASDGSAAAKAATRTALKCPWPVAASASGIVAKEVRADYRRSVLLAVLDRTTEFVAKGLKTTLRRRWPDAEVQVADAAPVDAIVRQAKRLRADVIVMGWRGHGALKRLLTGSVSHGVVRRAPCAVLVVRRPRQQVVHLVVGVDGSTHAKHAVEFVARIPSPRGGRVTLVTAIDVMRAPSQVHLNRAARSAVAAEVTRINRNRFAKAKKTLDRAAQTLRASGWNVRVELTRGAPLSVLLDAVEGLRADLLVVGARGVTGLTHMLLGSVAEGALNRSPVPILIVP